MHLGFVEPGAEGFQQGVGPLLAGFGFLIGRGGFDVRLNAIEFGDPGQHLLRHRTRTPLLHVIEVAPHMRPASGFDDLLFAVGGIIAPIVIGLEDPLPVAQEVLRVDALAVRVIIKKTTMGCGASACLR